MIDKFVITYIALLIVSCYSIITVNNEDNDTLCHFDRFKSQ